MGKGQYKKPRRKKKVKLMRAKAYRYSQLEHDDIVNEVATEYLDEGYTVELKREYYGPTHNTLFEVDLLAYNDVQVHIVEVKSSLSVKSTAKLEHQLDVRKEYFDNLYKWQNHEKIYRGVLRNAN